MNSDNPKEFVHKKMATGFLLSIFVCLSLYFLWTFSEYDKPKVLKAIFSKRTYECCVSIDDPACFGLPNVITEINQLRHQDPMPSPQIMDSVIHMIHYLHGDVMGVEKRISNALLKKFILEEHLLDKTPDELRQFLTVKQLNWILFAIVTGIALTLFWFSYNQFTKKNKQVLELWRRYELDENSEEWVELQKKLYRSYGLFLLSAILALAIFLSFSIDISRINEFSLETFLGIIHNDQLAAFFILSMGMTIYFGKKAYDDFHNLSVKH